MNGKESCGEAAATHDDMVLDLKLLRSGFSPTSDNQLVLDGYMEAYKEMNKFLGLLGSLLSMVTSDVESKVSILQEHRRSKDGELYKTVESMLSFEQKQANGGLPKDRNGTPSGVITLLRLHRALEFVAELFELLLRPKEGFFGMQVSRLYGATLSRHHGLLVRAAVSTALLALPAHATIIQRLLNGKTVMGEAVKADLDKVIVAMKAAYNHTQGLYHQYGYLDIP